MNSGSHRTEGTGSHRRHWPIHGRDREFLAPPNRFRCASHIHLAKNAPSTKNHLSHPSPLFFHSLFLHSFPKSAGEHFGAWEAFAWDADDSKGYVTNDDYPSKDVSESYPVSRTPLSSCPV